MLTIINNIIMTFINVLGFTYISSKYLNYDLKYKKVKTILSILFSTILLSLSIIFLNSNSKFIYTFLITFLLILFLYKENIVKTITTNLFSFITIMVSEVLCSTFLMIIFESQILYFETLIIPLNIVMMITACFLSIIFNKNITRLIDKINYNKDLSIMIVILNLILIIIVLLLNLTSDIISQIIIIVFIIFYLFIVIKYFINNKSKVDEYYMNYIECNEKLLEKYKMLMHENKNHLLLIKTMIQNKQCDNAIMYINEIIGDTDKNTYYKSLQNIGSPNLKGFLHHKINIMEEKNIIVILEISSKIKKIDIEELIPINRRSDFYEAIGIIVDNAIEAEDTSSEKVISIEIYLDNNNYVINVANTFNNEIDLNSLEKFGYSTKGKDRGVGLSILNKIIEKSDIFEIKREVIKNVFYCEFITKYNVRDN